MANILVTDDSNFLRRITCKILKGAGHTVIEAGDGVECLQHLQDDHPDVMFLDLVMPVMDGLETLRTLQEQGNTVPVIVLTADIQNSVRKECLELGAISFLNKPPKEDEVLAALQLALDKLANQSEEQS